MECYICIIPLSSLLLQDPDFYKKYGNYHRKVVVACLVWIVFGKTLTISPLLYNSHHCYRVSSVELGGETVLW